METQEIVDIVQASTEHLDQLQEQQIRLIKAIEQVENTANSTCHDIRQTFQFIRTKLLSILQAKESVLLKQTETIKKNSLHPLNQCKILIDNEILTIENYITEGKLLSQSSHCDKVEVFKDKASTIGSIPAVPLMEEVACITFHYDYNDLFTDFESRVQMIGCVSQMGPVQVSGVIEKPGAVLVEWVESDNEDKVVDVQAFRLQRAYGNLIQHPHLEANFHDCYIGTNTQFLSRDMCPLQDYSFRVCCQLEGSTKWSVWSQVYVTRSTIPSFCWQNSTQHYCVTNDNKLITKISPEFATHFSETAQFDSGHSIEFTFLECGEATDTQGIGLVDQSYAGSESLIRPGTFMLTTTGYVFIDGNKKTTRLPKIVNKSKVTFTCEKLSTEKYRIHIDCGNKTVTYDWVVYITEPLYFAVCLKGLLWKVLVE